MPCGHFCSVRQVAVEHRPVADRAFGHAASPRRCARRPGLPVSRARRSPAAPPDCAPVCFAKCKTIPPLHPSPASGPRRLPARLGKPTVKHTHMSAEAYPPDGPQISPPQGSQNFSVGAAAMERAVKCSMTRLREAMCPENFCARQAGGCAVPDPDRFGEPEFRPCHHTPVVSQVIPNIWRYEQWLTTKRTPTRPSNYSA